MRDLHCKRNRRIGSEVDSRHADDPGRENPRKVACAMAAPSWSPLSLPLMGIVKPWEVVDVTSGVQFDDSLPLMGIVNS